MQTFLHLSDLHIGDTYPLTKASVCDPQAVAMANVYPYLPGNLGHSSLALIAINKLYRKLRRQCGADNLSVIVTGDVTAFGKQSHFDNAREFLFGRFVLNRRHGIGLNSPTDLGIIPGNHDYFAGMPIPVGHRTGHFSKFFSRALPEVSWTVPLPDGRRLRFLEIDCDHDFEIGNRLPRITARASGRDHLSRLGGLLGRLPDTLHEPRIVLMHGSARHRGGFLQICELLADAHQELDAVCIAHRVKAILCGHIHASDLGAIAWPHNPPTTELCCGTSAQVLRPSINRITKLLVQRYLPRTNQVLVHQIVQRSGTVFWETAEYLLRYMEDEFLPSANFNSIQL